MTVGAVYALVALGFTLIYNASDVINFAQGEFVMLGGMATVFLTLAGMPLPLAALLAVILTVAVGLALHRLAIEPAREASPVALIMITLGASIFLRGAAQVVFDKRFHSLPGWFGNEPIRFGGAAILPQSLVVLGGAALIVLMLWLFFDRTLTGKAMIATAANRLAARLVGIDPRPIVGLSSPCRPRSARSPACWSPRSRSPATTSAPFWRSRASPPRCSAASAARSAQWWAD